MPSSQDIELKLYPFKEDSLARYGSSFAMREPVYEDAEPRGPLARWIDGFRRDPGSGKDPVDDLLAVEIGSLHGSHHQHHQHHDHQQQPPLLPSPDGSHYYDMRMAALRTAQSSLARRLKGRHLQMIAIGGSIGR